MPITVELLKTKNKDKTLKSAKKKKKMYYFHRKYQTENSLTSHKKKSRRPQNKISKCREEGNPCYTMTFEFLKIILYIKSCKTHNIYEKNRVKTQHSKTSSVTHKKRA